MKNEVLFSSENTRVEYFYDENSNHENLTFVFAPAENKSLEGNPYGGEVFFRNGFDTVTFKNLDRDWHQSIPLYLFDKINNILITKKYKKRVSYGSSMGGYAVIALSKILKIDTAIIFSPQYCIDEAFDIRWAADAKKINFVYRITKESINNNCKYFIFYDNKDQDELQIRRLMNLLPMENVQLIILPYTGHPSTNFLFEVGLLKKIIVMIANKNSIEGINCLENKRASKSYWHTLSFHLLKKNHLILSLAAINSAIEIDAKNAAFHFHKGLVLEMLGMSYEAANALEIAASIEPNNDLYTNKYNFLSNQI
jgi:hypothetical protein